MNETAYGDAVRPTPVVILKLPLRSYTLGHEAELYQRRNLLLLLSPEQFNALPAADQIAALLEAVLVCADPWSDRQQLQQPSIFNWRARWYHLKIRLWTRRLAPEDYPVALAQFRNYLDEAHHLPAGPDKTADEICNGKSDTPKGRPPGAPLLANLYLFACQLGTSNLKLDTWDQPYLATAWHYFAHHESAGAYKIENHEESAERQKHLAWDREAHEQSTAPTSDAVPAPHAPPAHPGLATPPPNLDEEPLNP